MFFKTNDISFEILTILKLSWNEKNGKSGIRPHHALSFRIKGSTNFYQDGEKINANSGEIAFVPAKNEYRQISSYEDLIVVHFMSNSDLPQKIKVLTPENSEYYEKLFRDLYSIWTKKQVGYKHECKSILCKIFTKMEREYAQTKSVDIHGKIQEAVSYIHENFTDSSLSVAFLSKMCGISETYFRKLFEELFSVTPIQYIKKLKVNYAKELLKSGYYTVEEAAYKCGFANVYYFSSFIKKETGHTPVFFKN